jgi:hypothetical protein
MSYYKNYEEFKNFKPPLVSIPEIPLSCTDCKQEFWDMTKSDRCRLCNQEFEMKKIIGDWKCVNQKCPVAKLPIKLQTSFTVPAGQEGKRCRQCYKLAELC